MKPRTSTGISTGILISLLAACSGSSGGSAVPTFGIPTGVPTNGASADSIVIGDVDRDGFADVVVADSALDRIAVLRGAGAGGLAPGVATPSIVGVGAIALADLDGDRQLDLVAASGTGAEYAVMLGNGDGTLQAPVAAALPWPAAEVLLADVTGDGLVDLVASSQLAAEIAVFAGSGAGTFAAAQLVTLGYLPAAVVSGDFDRDGRIDLATAGVGGARIDIWRSAGGGAFLPAVANTVGNQVGVLAVGDFDGDGVLDLSAIRATTGELLLLLGDGHGSFAIAGAAMLPAGVVDGLAVGDFDGDGWLDVAAAIGAQFAVTFGQGAVWRGGEQISSGATVTRSVAANDLGGDGRWELVYATGTAEVVVLRSQQQAPVGLSNYGVGTPECAGRIGMWANGVPRLGNLEFAYAVTNAPRSTFGFLLQGGPEDVAGSDPFGIGVLFHIGLGFLNTELVFSDALGRALLPRPVPNDPGLVGLPVYVQTLWQGAIPGTCASSAQGISSSIGLVCTVQP